VALFDAKPMVLAREAHLVGIKTDQIDGWIRFVLPKEVQVSTKMYLSREQAQLLVKHLQRWISTVS
jgi:hypothetical protein